MRYLGANGKVSLSIGVGLALIGSVLLQEPVRATSKDQARVVSVKNEFSSSKVFSKQTLMSRDCILADVIICHELPGFE